MYSGAGLNKLLEPDWRSGQYFAHFLTQIHPSYLYSLAAPLLPGIWTAKLMCWSIIAAELGAGLMFPSARFRPIAVCVAAAVHSGAAILVTGDYGIYLAAVLASYLSCLSWPTRIELRVDPRSRWRGMKTWTDWFDQDRLVVWRNHEPSTSAPFTLSAFDRTWTGWGALGCLIVWTPAVYLIAIAILTGFSGMALRIVIRGAGIVVMLILIGALVVKIRSWRRKVAHV